MANKNFNKQVVPARTKLAIGGPATKKEITNDLSSGTKEMRERKNERLKRFNDKKRGKVVVNKTQKGGRKRTKSMMDSTRAKSLGLK